MSKSMLSLVVLMSLPLAVNQAVAGETDSGRAVHHSGQASGHASAGAAHGIAASGKATSAAVAIPLSAAGAALGSAGAVSAGSANQSMKAATSPIGTPLKITDEAIITVPPDEALKKP